MISDMFILLMNKNEHSEEISKSKWTLKTITDYHAFPNEDDTEYENDDKNIDNAQTLIGKEESEFKMWIKDLISNVRTSYVDDKLNESLGYDEQKQLNVSENIYYVDDVKNDVQNSLVEILSTIPLWSNVMTGFFKSCNNVATSSPTEVAFKNMKHIIFKNENNVRVDVFVERYVQYLIGKFKQFLAGNKNENNEREDIVEEAMDESSDSQSQTVEVSQEIWRNKNVDVRTSDNAIKRTKRAQFSILNVTQEYCVPIPILPNGGYIARVQIKTRYYLPQFMPIRLFLSNICSCLY